MFLPGESRGRRSLVGCRLWGRRVRPLWLSTLLLLLLVDRLFNIRETEIWSMWGPVIREWKERVGEKLFWNICRPLVSKTLERVANIQPRAARETSSPLPTLLWHLCQGRKRQAQGVVLSSSPHPPGPQDPKCSQLRGLAGGKSFYISQKFKFKMDSTKA